MGLDATGLVDAGGMRLKPLAGHPLGLGYLFARHPRLEDVVDDVFSGLSIRPALGRREINPHIGKHIVHRAADSSAPLAPRTLRSLKTHGEFSKRTSVALPLMTSERRVSPLYLSMNV